MPAPTTRSQQERALYDRDGVLKRNLGTEKVVSLDPPDRIKEHPEKLDCWNYICTDLAGRQLLSPSYIMSIVILVDNIVAYNEYVVALDSSGPIVPMIDIKGEIRGYKENPLFTIVKQTEKMIITMCEKFGLNPRDAVYTANPDLKTKTIESVPSAPSCNKITYFA